MQGTVSVKGRITYTAFTSVAFLVNLTGEIGA